MAKIHDGKDPGQHLGPMFRQVLSALFSLMERYEAHWKKVKGSETLDIFGYEGTLEPEPVNVDLESLIGLFRAGHHQFSALWKEIFCKSCFKEITRCAEMSSDEFHLPTPVWVHLLYELAATFHLWEVNRNKLLDLVTPLYFARVASFVRQSWVMTSEEAEELVEDQANRFEEQKDYLVKVWDEKSTQKAKG